MKKFKMKRFTTVLALVLAFAFGTKGEAAEYSDDMQGLGYQEASRYPSMAPALALGAIAVVAIVAVALQNQSHGHGHSH